jgi:hypothetical protein
MYSKCFLSFSIKIEAKGSCADSITMPLTQINRETMRELGSNLLTMERKMKVEAVVSYIYKEAVQVAERYNQTIYRFNITATESFKLFGKALHLPSNIPEMAGYQIAVTEKDILDNIDAIIEALQELFPGHSIKIILYKGGVPAQIVIDWF